MSHPGVHSEELILEMSHISKTFPGVRALDDVSFDLRRGEVHALVGENGAGKSTLIKILAGVHPKDSGSIALNGRPVEISNPKAALDLGISVIYQEFNLISNLNALENIFLGRLPSKNRLGRVDWKRLRKQVAELMESLDAEIDLECPVKWLSVAHQQMVEIAKALSMKARIIVMDEPTATLTGKEIDRLFAVIKKLKAEGVSIIYISHRLDEISKIADRVTVLRDGQKVGTYRVDELDLNAIVRLMVGREVKDKFPRERVPMGPEILKVTNLSRRGKFENVSFSVHRGEIVGIAGLVGAGRTELVRAIFGADPIDSGSVQFNGKVVHIKDPHNAVRIGMALLPEERKTDGLILGMTVKENSSLAILDRFTRAGFVRKSRESRTVSDIVRKLEIRTPSLNQQVKNLSGGNQQKVILARWFLKQSQLVIFDEPTRGIDVGAKVEIYKLMNELVRNGAGILMISSELPEVLGISDRILVMKDGRIVAEMDAADATQETVLAYALGGQKQ